jgi:hypothetical protein
VITIVSMYEYSALSVNLGQKSIHGTVVLKEGSGDIRELERVVNRKTQVPRVKLPKNDESGFGFLV